ncbi:NADPH-dependent assimilatory sulfite reductase hemoprotein subunit [Nitrosomonas sp. Nm33]|uniref:NADPH-dependent assimilatory sulfite reductase hemoprotein subunit n=1 Tax=Nitrosomonas sp. Nm33 TaxID=133724 RepID=UPI000B899EA0|nr:NADPH-dependent assimilatory sulfite reductase hemoprotein subunit [Nitrosomonas sp. Nm33]
MTEQNLSPVEGIKTRSRGLRGTLAEGLKNQLTGQLSADDQQLVKHHGIYQQDDRDRRNEREAKKLEPAYSFMIRLRLPGGDITPQQWLGLQPLLNENTTGVFKITTRQTIQVHGVVKSKLKPTLQWFNKYGLDTIATCGDVNRNVMAGSHPSTSSFHEEVHAFAVKISKYLLPKTKAYTEIWLDGERLDRNAEPEPDPLYQNRYMPRKFKVGIAIPPHNEIDIFTQDVGLIAIEKNGRLAGFNVTVGGGLGCTHGNAATYPRLGDMLGFIKPDQVLDTVWQIAAVQRDNGNRTDRKQARLKYTIDHMGLEVFKADLESRLGFTLAAPRSFAFNARADYYGWLQDHRNRWHYTLFIENGRVVDNPEYRAKSALDVIARSNLCNFRLTGNQNIMLLNVAAEDKAAIDEILEAHGIIKTQAALMPIRTHAIACVALPTCPLALAEGQRYLPELIGKVEKLLEKYALTQDEISIRLTGCPNGCGRPFVAEIGLVGRSVGHYDLRLGGDRLGYRLNTLYKEGLDESKILSTLDSLLADYARGRMEGETFGDYCQRQLFTQTSET